MTTIAPSASTALLRALNEAHHRRFSLTALRALCILDNCESINTSDLARRLGVSTAVVTGLIDRLEYNDLVRRTHAQDDRRIIRLSRTATGTLAITDILNA